MVHDGVETFKSNTYGQKSLQLGDSAYKALAAPVLPYLSKPYQYVEPYVKKADDLGDKALARVDATFPVVTRPTGELYSQAKELIFLPYIKAFEGKDHLFNVYTQEHKKAGGENGSGVVLTGKAALSTVLIVSAETFQIVQDFVLRKRQQTQQHVDNKVNN